MDDVRMPFGKHRGKLIADVPASYLLWCLRECDLSPWLEEEIINVLEGRGESYSAPPADNPRVTGTTAVEAVLSQWYSDLCRRWHPDRGGTTEGMAAINDAHDRLKKLLKDRKP